MNRISNLATASIVVSCSALAGISIGTPLVSGDVATLENRHETSHRELSQAQLRALSQWLRQHKSGWHGMITEATNQPRPVQFSIKDAAGKTGSIAVVARADGSHYLQFISSSEKWSYRSLGGLFKSWAATRELSSEELNQLRQAAAIAYSPK